MNKRQAKKQRTKLKRWCERNGFYFKENAFLNVLVSQLKGGKGE